MPLWRVHVLPVNLRLGGFRVAKSGSYVAKCELNDINGEKLTRRVTIRSS